jgi:hypothetical protein
MALSYHPRDCPLHRKWIGGVVLRRPLRTLRARGPRLLVLALGIIAGLVTQAGAAETILIGMNDVDQPGGPDELVRIDRSTGVASRLHVFNASGLNLLESLAYDPRDNVLWSTNSGVLVRIQPVTFATTPVGNTGLDDVDGLAVHPATGALYGITYGGNDLVRIDKVDAGALILNGAVEQGYRLEDLAFDPSGRLYILTSRALVEVNPQTGARLSRVFLQGGTSLEGLVWDPVRGTFLSAADRGGYKDVVTLDRATGQIAFLDPVQHSGFKDIEALALVPSSPVVPIALQGVTAERDAAGAALLQWLCDEPRACTVERGLQREGPWAAIASVGSPLSGHAGAWRYELRDAAAAAADDLRARPLFYRILAAGADGAPASLLLEVDAALPGRARLLPNAPNPFNPVTRFAFELVSSSRVSLTLYDVRGAIVHRVQTTAGPGRHALEWDGRDAAGRVLAAGVYPYELSAGGATLRGSAVLVK